VAAIIWCGLVRRAVEGMQARDTAAGTNWGNIPSK